MARNLYEAFAKRAERRKPQAAIQHKKGGRWISVSYGELLNNVRAFSSALRADYGVENGDKVAVALGNRPEWPVAFFAVIAAGAIPVPVNAQGTSGDVGNILADSGCMLALTEEGGPRLNIKTLCVDSDEFTRAVSAPPRGDPRPGSKRDDTACIMYTSGTTSHPRGVMLSHGNLLSNMYALYKLGLMKSGDGIVSVLPLYHAYAMAITTIGPLVYGGRVVYPGSIRAEEVTAAMREAHPALFVGVPLVFEMFHKNITGFFNKLPPGLRFVIDKAAGLSYFLRKTTGVNLGRYLFYPIHMSLGATIRAYMSGGAKLNEKVEQDLFKLGFTILNGYGLTETSPVLTVNPIDSPRTGSVGLPLKNVEVRIADADENGIGEIVVRGPNVMKGYYKNEDLTRGVIEDGWFRTRDIGYMDKDSYLFIVGRADDAITLGTGLSMCPDELEEAYLAAAPVKEICVFDAPSPRGKSDAPAIWAVIVPDMEFFGTKGITDTYYYLKMALEKVSRAISIPERLMGFSVTLDTLPRTIMGKVKRREVKNRYLAGQINEAFRPREKRLTDEDQQLLRKPEAGRVIECLKSWTRVEKIAPKDSFELDLGLGLVERSELALELEKRLGLRISEDDINKIFTVGELIAHVEKVSR